MIRLRERYERELGTPLPDNHAKMTLWLNCKHVLEKAVPIDIDNSGMVVLRLQHTERLEFNSYEVMFPDATAVGHILQGHHPLVLEAGSILTFNVTKAI